MAEFRIGIWINSSKRGAFEAARRFAQTLTRRGVRPFAPPSVADGLGLELDKLGLERLDPSECDVLAAFGGDGTILSAVSRVARRGVPILGVNVGRVGFLTEIEPDGCDEAVSLLLSGKYSIEERMLLSATIGDRRYIALNDVVLARASTLQTVRIDVTVDGYTLDPYIGDGVIFASPTGSTAYALSAGGPVISPLLPCIQIAPICTHDLRTRHIVLPPSAKVGAFSNFDVQLFIDGEAADIGRGEVVNITRAEECARFIRFGPARFFELVHKKLTGWSGESR